MAVHESGVSIIFYSEPFEVRKDFRTAQIEFFSSGSDSIKGCFDSLRERDVRNILLGIFGDADELESCFMDLEDNGAVREFEFVLNEAFSSPFPAYGMASAAIARLADGRYRLHGFVSSLQKIRKREETLREENQFLSSILAGMGEAVCVVDKWGEVVFSSPGYKGLMPDLAPFLRFSEVVEKRKLRVSGDGNGSGTGRLMDISYFPLRNPDGELIGTVNVAAELPGVHYLDASPETAGSDQAPSRPDALQAIVGESGPIRKVIDEIEKIGRFDTLVFIQGDTGTGKELVAMAIHKLSPRRDKPFVAINCGALTETLLDSQLFGHVKGAFTGAETETGGLFEEADGGTIFLDEIGEMSLGTQVKLLRVLQDGSILKLGSSKGKAVDVRVITATHRNIEDLVRDGRFREDLYYRIHVFPIYTPRLRERGNDILILANRFLREFAAGLRKEIRGISEHAAKVLKKHAWPGNVRELRNVIERAVVLCDADILRVEDLLLSFTNKLPREEEGPSPAPSLADNPEDPKKILDCLEKNHWNKTLTAKDLNISRATLWRKMKELSKISP